MDELTVLIDAISEKLGVAASEIYSTIQNQARLYIFKSFILCLLYIGIIAFTCFFIKRIFIDKTKIVNVGCWERGEEKVSIFRYHDENDDYGATVIFFIFAIVSVAISAISLFGLIFTLDSVVDCIFNPKFWALDQILSYLK